MLQSHSVMDILTLYTSGLHISEQSNFNLLHHNPWKVLGAPEGVFHRGGLPTTVPKVESSLMGGFAGLQATQLRHELRSRMLC
jgi:hypothetical protein